MTRRERERRDRRDAILAAARHVFARRGFQEATLEEIAAVADFGKGTLYNYFSSKEALFRSVMLALLDDMKAIARSVARSRQPTRDIFRSYVRQMIAYYHSNEDILRIVVRDLQQVVSQSNPGGMAPVFDRMDSIAGIFAQLLRKDMGRHLIVAEDPHELARIFFAIIHSRIVRRCVRKKSMRGFDPDREAALVTRLFFDGIALS